MRPKGEDGGGTVSKAVGRDGVFTLSVKGVSQFINMLLCIRNLTQQTYFSKRLVG